MIIMRIDSYLPSLAKQIFDKTAYLQNNIVTEELFIDRVKCKIKIDKLCILLTFDSN